MIVVGINNLIGKNPEKSALIVMQIKSDGSFLSHSEIWSFRDSKLKT
jgi:hypothetical protein